MDSLSKIKEYQKFGSKLGLQRIEKLTDLLHKPQDGLNYIHVAGTNGKGSVSGYIHSVLLENGYSVGMFTSPFMEEFRQSIVVDNECMTESQLDSLYIQIDEAVDKMRSEGWESPTEFEIITTIALMYFQDKAPDFVVMEVGLGGIGDSTNIIGSPLVSVITSLGLDHCEVLGDTIQQIAAEKAGIIKPHVPVISNVTGDGKKVIAKSAYEKESPLIDATKYKESNLEKDINGYTFSVRISGTLYPDIKIGMIGEHQIQNAITALTTIEYLRSKALITLDRVATQRAMNSAKLTGRFEILGESPVLVFDGAHNPQGAEALSQTVLDVFPEKKILTVFSIIKNKDSKAIISEFLKFSSSFIIADTIEDKEIDIRALTKVLKDEAEAKCISIDPILVFGVKSDLLDFIKDTEFDVILFTGSLYFIRGIRPDFN